MINLESLTEFLGWCTVINYGLLLFSTGMLVTSVGDWARGIHQKLFKIPEQNLDELYFNYLGNYKLAIFVFNLVPYIALKIMA